MSDTDVQRALRVLARAGINPATLCTPQQIVAAMPISHPGDDALARFFVAADPGALSLGLIARAAAAAAGEMEERRHHPLRRDEIYSLRRDEIYSSIPSRGVSAFEAVREQLRAIDSALGVRGFTSLRELRALQAEALRPPGDLV